MRTKKYFIYLAIVFLISFLSACSTTTDPAEAYRDETAEQIFQGGETALREKNYKEATKRFEALDAQYPYGRNTETAQLHIIYAYYMDSEYLSAEAAADRFIHAYPTSPHVDYAYYMRGLANYYQNMGIFERIFAIDFATRDLTQVKKSFNDFSQLQQRYPDSPYAPAAHQYTIYLRNVLAGHQLHVAQYYFNREAYVASANRASILVEHYQGAPEVPDALVMMAKSYYQLHLTDQMNQTIEVLNYNYPNSKYVEEVTGNQLSSKSFSIVTRNDATIPAQKAPVTPPAVANGEANYTANGDRGSIRPVSEMVHSIQQAGYFNHTPPPAGTPVEQVSDSRQIQPTAPAQVQPQPQQPTVATTGSASRVPAATATAKSSSALTLGGLLEKLSNSAMFASHPKTAAGTPAANDAVATDEGAQGVPPAATEPASRPVLSENGTRR